MRKQSKLGLQRTTIGRLTRSQLAGVIGGTQVPRTLYKCDGAQCTYDESGCVWGDSVVFCDNPDNG